MENWRALCPGVDAFTSEEELQLLRRQLYANVLNPNTKKNMLQSLIVFYRNLDSNHQLIPGLSESHRHYEAEAEAIHQCNQSNIVVDSLDVVKEKIKGKFPYASKASILTQIYAFWPMRDNCQLKVDGHLIPKYTGNVFKWTMPQSSILIRVSKCLEAPVERLLSEELTQEITEYMATNHIKQFEYLFGCKRLNKSIARYFRVCGVEGGINYLRKVHRATALRTRDHTVILETAQNSFHRVKTARHYDTKEV